MIEPNPKTNSLQQSVTKIQRGKIPKIFSRVMTMLYHNLTELENPKTDDEAAAIKKRTKVNETQKMYLLRICLWWFLHHPKSGLDQNNKVHANESNKNLYALKVVKWYWCFLNTKKRCINENIYFQKELEIY